MRQSVLRRIAPRRGAYPEAWTRPYFPRDSEDLKGQAARSTFWVFSGAYLQRFLQIFVTAILARLLTPEDYGLVGMATVFMGLARVFGNFGMGAAIIYRQDASQVHLATAFWFNLAIGAALAAAVLAASPLVASYFGDPRVVLVLMVMSISFVVEGLGSIPFTVLTKTLDFKRIALVNLAATVTNFTVALCAVVLFEAGYWGLVAGHLAGSLAGSLLRFALVAWRPRWLFDSGAFRDLFRYGRNFFVQGMLGYASGNADYLIVGHRMGAAPLGLYFFAYDIPASVRTQFSQRLTSILFPVLCKVSDEAERFRRGYLTALRYIATVTFPASLGMLAVAEPLVLVLYGEQWVGAIAPLRILCLAALANSVLTTMGSVFSSKGRPDIEVKWNLCRLPVLVAAIWIGAGYGLEGVAVAMTLGAYLSLIAMWLAMRVAGIPFSRWLRSIAPPLLGSVLMAAVVTVADVLVVSQAVPSPFARLPCLVVLGVAVYAGYALIFQRGVIADMLAFVRGGMAR